MALDFPNSPSIGQMFPSPAQTGIPVWRWDGSEWAPVNAGSGQALGVKHRWITASGTYVPSAGMIFCIAEGVGGGGGGGGSSGSANFIISGGGGASGAYAKRMLTAAQIGSSQPVTIGAAGTPGTGGGSPVSSGAGGDTYIGSIGSPLLLAKGGNGGTNGLSTSALASGGIGGLASASVGDVTIDGANGVYGYLSGTIGVFLPSGAGGSSMFGPGGTGLSSGGGATNSGNPGKGYGSGGSGSQNNNVTGGSTGSAGAAGAILITEYGLFNTLYVPPTRGAIHGLTLSTAGGSTTFSVAAGAATDASFFDSMVLPSAISKTTAAWAVGTAAGALDTGTIAINTWYHAFLIKRPDTGVVDVLVSLSPTSPTLPANYTLYRRIGSMQVGGAGNWRQFVQFGDEFIWSNTISDVNVTNLGTGNTNYALTVPTGLSVIARFHAGMSNASAGVFVLVQTPYQISEASGSVVGNNTLGNPTAGTTAGAKADLMVRTDTNGNVKAVATATNTSFTIATIGWFDTRGRDA